MNLMFFVTVALLGGEPSPQNGLVPFEQNDKWGFKDAKGNVIVEAQYDEVRRFADGLAPVNRGAKKHWSVAGDFRRGGKWGYIDMRGKLIVPFSFDYAEKFSDGLAQVWDDSIKYLDTSGKVVIALDYDPNTTAGDFHEGMAPVLEYRSGKDCRTRFIDKKGKTLFMVDGYAKEFCNGMAVLAINQHVNEPCREDYLCGYIDRAGKVVIAPHFAKADGFHEGLAAVHPMRMSIGRATCGATLTKRANTLLSQSSMKHISSRAA